MRENSMSVEEAARLLGVSQQFVRVGLQKGVLPFGWAVVISNKNYTYCISRELFEKYTGINTEE